jgi:hypothetical protein
MGATTSGAAPGFPERWYELPVKLPWPWPGEGTLERIGATVHPCLSFGIQADTFCKSTVAEPFARRSITIQRGMDSVPGVRLPRPLNISRCRTQIGQIIRSLRLFLSLVLVTFPVPALAQNTDLLPRPRHARSWREQKHSLTRPVAISSCQRVAAGPKAAQFGSWFQNTQHAHRRNGPIPLSISPVGRATSPRSRSTV